MSEGDSEADRGRRDGPRSALRDAGILQLIVAGLMLVPLLVSVLYREWYTALSLLASAGVAAAVGGATYRSSLCNFRSVLHAVFESMSGHTTTGLTMTAHEPSICEGLLFYRSFAQWIGGVGIIVFSIAVLRNRGRSPDTPSTSRRRARRRCDRPR